MTLYQFNSLTQEEQADVVGGGQFLLFREETNYSITLYKVEDFYVELYYNNSLKTIVRFQPFISKKKLELYFKWQKN